MKVSVLNSLHMQYSHRFKVEFQQLLEQQAFAAAIFRNNHLLFRNEDTSYNQSLTHCFGCSFEGMALGLCRIWDEDGERQKVRHRKDGTVSSLISIPNLVTYFAEEFLGCQGLAPGREDRMKYEALYADPMRKRLRVVRTEALAHSVVVGGSRDRDKSDIKGKQEFDICNGDALAYCRKTLDLLFSLNDQLTISKWRANKSMTEMMSEWNDRHIAFLRHFEPDVQ